MCEWFKFSLILCLLKFWRFFLPLLKCSNIITQNRIPYTQTYIIKIDKFYRVFVRRATYDIIALKKRYVELNICKLLLQFFYFYLFHSQVISQNSFCLHACRCNIYLLHKLNDTITKVNSSLVKEF